MQRVRRRADQAPLTGAACRRPPGAAFIFHGLQRWLIRIRPPREWFAQFGGTLPKRFVATFDDSDTLHRAVSEGLGIALGRVTLARPLVEAGRLVLPCAQRLKAEFAHYLVYPARSESHAGLLAFRDWLLAEARADTARA